MIVSYLEIILYFFNIIMIFILFLFIFNLIKKHDINDSILIKKKNFPKSLKGCYINKYKNYFEIHNDRNLYYTIYNKDLKEFLKENSVFKKIKIINKS